MMIVYKGKKPKNDLIVKKTMVTLIVVVLTFFTGALGGIALAIDPDRFSDGVWIGGVDVSALSYSKAEEIVLSKAEADISAIKLNVKFLDRTVEFDANDLGIGTNAEDVLNEAFYYNKQKEDSLADRFDKSAQLSGRNFAIDIEVDQKKLRDTLEKFSDEFSIRPVDAQALFHKDTKTFVYIPGKDGEKIDVEQTIREINERIRKGDYSQLAVPGKQDAPKWTQENLKENTVSIGSCVTTATGDENRNTNIRLMCEAIDGLKLEPGEVLSVNGLVGERTEEKGFKSAPAIIDGKKLSNEVGGGICQVSGTLYNAALLANMEIVERVHHSWPSSYLPVGLDSTLNWDDKDLKIKNTSDMPVYLSATFLDRTVRVEIYGEPLPDGMTIEIDNNIINRIDPPAPDIIYTNELPLGARQTQVSAREGYDVIVIRNFLIEGRVLESEIISKDYYPAVKGVILEGTEAQEK